MDDTKRRMFLVDQQTAGRASVLNGLRQAIRRFLSTRTEQQWTQERPAIRDGLDTRLSTAQQAVADLTWTYLDALHDEHAPGAPSTTPPQDVPGLWDAAFEAFDVVTDDGGEHADAVAAAVAEIDATVEDTLDEVVLDTATQHGEAINAREQRAGRPAKVIGYRRVVHPDRSVGGVCGLCVVAATRVYRRGDLRKIHDGCKCTVAAITTASDPGDAMNRIDLPEVYRQSDGMDRASLKRTRYRGNPAAGLTPALVPQRRKTAAQSAAEARRAQQDASRGVAEYDQRIASLEKALANARPGTAQAKALRRRLEDEKAKRALAASSDAFVLKQIEIYQAMKPGQQRTRQLARYRAEAKQRGLAA